MVGWKGGGVMGIENLQIWQWIILGAVVGLAIGYTSTFAGPDHDPVMRSPLTAGQFAANLGKSIDGQPAIRDIIIHPSRDGQNLVTGERWFNERYSPFAFYAEIPFKTGASSA